MKNNLWSNHGGSSPLVDQATTTRRNRVLIVEDHPIVRAGVVALLGDTEDLEPCGVANTRQTAIQAIESLKPDLVLLDLRLSDVSGLDLLPEVKALCPEQRVLVFSVCDELSFALPALRLGASGYVMKHEKPEVLLLAIRKVLAGEQHVSQTVAKWLVRGSVYGHLRTSVDPFGSVTPRELQVFRLIGKGKSTSQIATELTLSIKTIETYQAKLKEKLNIKTGGQLARVAVTLDGETVDGTTNGS